MDSYGLPAPVLYNQVPLMPKVSGEIDARLKHTAR
jgi:hypothetical protein